MRLFRTWSRAELIDGIRGIEEGLATGAASVGYSAAGQVQYAPRADAIRTLQQLYDRLDEMDGATIAPRIGFRTFNFHKGV